MQQGLWRKVFLTGFMLIAAIMTQHVTANTQNEQRIVQIATQAVLKVFNYNYQNYQQVFNDAKPYFTDHGWRSFSAAMQRSENIKAVEDKKITVSAKLIGKATLIEHSKQNGREHWIVTAPLEVKYSGADFNSDHQVKATISVIKNAQDNTVGVNQLVVEPLTPTAETTTSPQSGS